MTLILALLALLSISTPAAPQGIIPTPTPAPASYEIIDGMACFLIVEDPSHSLCGGGTRRLYRCYPDYPELLPMVFKATCISSIHREQIYLPFVIGGNDLPPLPTPAPTMIP